MTSPKLKKALRITAGAIAMTGTWVLVDHHAIPWATLAEAIPLSEHRHSHNHEGLTWPPQPRGITDVVIHSDRNDEERDRTRNQARMD